MLVPFFAALAYGGNIIVDKFALSKRKIPLTQYVPYVFLYLFLFAALVAPFFGRADWGYLFNAHQDPLPLFLFLTMIVLAITQNIFYYQSLAKESLYEFETITMMTPLITILLSWIFFPERWNPNIGLAALVAGVALVWSHWEKHHLKLSHYSLQLIIAVVAISLEDIVVTNLLQYHIISPAALYAIRTLILFVFFFAYYKPSASAARRPGMRIIALSGFLGAMFMILKWYGYVTLGIPYTVLVTLLAPIAVYTASALVMHERMRPRVLIAASIIGFAVIYALSFQFP